MALGQPTGPPASYRQVQQLTELIHAAGHTDFRDARGPLGLTQRQAGGKFTRDEADAFIARLESEAEITLDGSTVAPPFTGRPIVSRRETDRAAALAKLSDHVLAAELQRRGWIVMEP